LTSSEEAFEPEWVRVVLILVEGRQGRRRYRREGKVKRSGAGERRVRKERKRPFVVLKSEGMKKWEHTFDVDCTA
jgi:hypothetical protein